MLVEGDDTEDKAEVDASDEAQMLEGEGDATGLETMFAQVRVCVCVIAAGWKHLGCCFRKALNAGLPVLHYEQRCSQSDLPLKFKA